MFYGATNIAFHNITIIFYDATMLASVIFHTTTYSVLYNSDTAVIRSDSIFAVLSAYYTVFIIIHPL